MWRHGKIIITQIDKVGVRGKYLTGLPSTCKIFFDFGEGTLSDEITSSSCQYKIDGSSIKDLKIEINTKARNFSNPSVLKVIQLQKGVQFTLIDDYKLIKSNCNCLFASQTDGLRCFELCQASLKGQNHAFKNVIYYMKYNENVISKTDAMGLASMILRNCWKLNKEEIPIKGRYE